MSGPARKLVGRYETVAVKLRPMCEGPPKTPWAGGHYEGQLGDHVLRLLVFHTETPSEREQVEDGLRISGYTILGAIDLHTVTHVNTGGSR